MENYPYADHLRANLQHMLSTPGVQVDVEGRAGDQVRGLYVKRLKLKLEAAVEAPYDWVIVMGGTNDLGWGQQPHEIFENLSRPSPSMLLYKDPEQPIGQLMSNQSFMVFALHEADHSIITEQIWQLAIDTGAKVLALNVIETAASSAGMVQKRNLLNDMIVHHEDDHLYVEHSPR